MYIYICIHTYIHTDAYKYIQIHTHTHTYYVKEHDLRHRRFNQLSSNLKNGKCLHGSSPSLSFVPNVAHLAKCLEGYISCRGFKPGQSLNGPVETRNWIVDHPHPDWNVQRCRKIPCENGASCNACGQCSDQPPIGFRNKSLDLNLDGGFCHETHDREIAILWESKK